jgi:hypothetical protein
MVRLALRRQSWDGQLGRDPRIASEGLFGHARGATICDFIVVIGHCCHRADVVGYGT